MEDKLVIETLANAVKEGTMTLDKVPEKYREEVKTIVEVSL